MPHTPAPGLPSTLSTIAHEIIASMFANQADWLICNVSSAIHPADWTPPLEPGALVLAGSHGVAVTRADPGTIDHALGWLGRTGSGDVVIWSAMANPLADVRLLARGGRDSFRPRWMWRALDGPLPEPRIEADVDLVIASVRDLNALRAATDVPYVSPNQIANILDIATNPGAPRRTWMLLARQRRRFGDGPVVGVGILHLTPEDTGLIGGLYNLGVDPAWQGKGIGTALTTSICRIARDAGASRVALNATPDGERIYRQLDFAVAGDGQTWFVPVSALRNRPSPEQIRIAEAIGHGDIARLDRAMARWESLPNGESPIRFAARFEQRETLQWLLDQDAALDIAPLWSAGLREEAFRAARNERWLNRQWGPEARTPLHDAVCDHDRGLVQMLLDAGADLTIRDSQWRGRPLDWANALGHPDLAALIEAAMREP